MDSVGKLPVQEKKKLHILTFGNPLIKLENLANVLRAQSAF